MAIKPLTPITIGDKLKWYPLSTANGIVTQLTPKAVKIDCGEHGLFATPEHTIYTHTAWIPKAAIKYDNGGWTILSWFMGPTFAFGILKRLRAL